MPQFTFAFIAYSQMSANAGNPLNNSTTTANGTFTVNATTTPVVVTVDDDDGTGATPEFDDAFIDPGPTSQTLISPLTVNGVTYPAGAIVELEFQATMTTGENFYYIRIGGTNVGIGGTTLPQPGQTYTIGSTSDGQEEAYTNLACFTQGTLIQTPDGERLIETIREGDLVMTADHGPQPVRWIRKQRLSALELRQNPELAPVHISAGALGNKRDLRVSPQHRMLLTGWQSELYFGEPNILAAAKGLVDGDRIRVAKTNFPVVYYHMLFDRHQIVFAEGIPSESLFLGDYSMDGIAPETRRELVAIFPDLVDDADTYGQLAYPPIKPREASAFFAQLSA